MLPDEPAAQPFPPSAGDTHLTPEHAAQPGVPTLGQRFTAFCEVLLASDVPTQLFIMQVLGLVGIAPVDTGGNLSFAYVWLLSMLDAVLLITLIQMLLRARGESARALYLGRARPGREVMFGLVITPGVVVLSLLALAGFQRYVPWLHNVPTNPLGDLLKSPQDAWLFGVVAVCAGGIREEIQRAFILHRFEQYLGGGWLGLAVFSVAFGAGHLIQGRDVAVITAALGALWGSLYLTRRNIVAPAVSHSAFNVVQIVQHTMLA